MQFNKGPKMDFRCTKIYFLASKRPTVIPLSNSLSELQEAGRQVHGSRRRLITATQHRHLPRATGLQPLEWRGNEWRLV